MLALTCCLHDTEVNQKQMFDFPPPESVREDVHDCRGGGVAGDVRTRCDVHGKLVLTAEDTDVSLSAAGLTVTRP